MQWPLGDVNKLYVALRKIGTFVMAEDQFCSWISKLVPSVQEVDVLKLFDILDQGETGRVNCLRFLASIALLSDENFTDKTQFCFELFDFNLNGVLNHDELVLMIQSTIMGTFRLLELDSNLESIDDKVFEEVAESAIRVYDRNANDTLEYTEFVSWAKGNRQVMRSIDLLCLYSKEGKKEHDESLQRFENTFIIATGDESVVTEEISPEMSRFNGAENLAEADTALEMEWVYGYSGPTSMNNVKYLGENRDLIIYPVGRLLVIYDSKSNSQQIYIGHKAPVLALDVKGFQVASASADGEVHIWNSFMIDQISETKVLNVGTPYDIIRFNNYGNLLACTQSENLSKISTIDIWDIKTQSKYTDSIGIKASVSDISWDTELEALAVCGDHFLKVFFDFKDCDCKLHGKKAANHEDGIGTFASNEIQFDEDSPSDNFTCVSFLGSTIVAGTDDGDLYQIDKRTCKIDRIIAAHCKRFSVTCLSEWYGGLVSCSSDGEIKMWDMGLCPLEYVESEARSNAIILVSTGDTTSFGNAAVTSIAFSNRTKSRVALIGMAAGDILEVNLDMQKPNRKKWLVQSHGKSRVSCVAAFPSSTSKFITCSSQDQSLRVWDKQTHSQQYVCVLGSKGTSIAFSPSGKVIAVGMTNGEVSIRDPTNRSTIEKELFRIKCPRAAMEVSVIGVRFSPDGRHLAVTNASGSSFLFKVERKPTEATLGYAREHYACVMVLKPEEFNFFGSLQASLVWSKDGKFLQTSFMSADVLHMYWDIAHGGNLVENHLNDMKFVEWDVGAYPQPWTLTGLSKNIKPTSYGVRGDILLCGDNDGGLSVCKFPCLDPVYQLRPFYSGKVGNANPVTSVTFIENEVIVTTSEGLFQWKLLNVDVDENEVISNPVEMQDISRSMPMQMFFEETNNDSQHVAQWRMNACKPSEEEQSLMEGARDFIEKRVKRKDTDLQLSWVQGAVTNIAYVSSHLLAFSCAHRLVALHLQGSSSSRSVSPVQSYIHQSHTGPITAFTVSNKSFIACASSQTVDILCANQLTILKSLSLTFPVKMVEFSTDGSLISVVGNDSFQTLVVYDWRAQRIIGQTSGVTPKIHSAVWYSPNGFVTTGGNKAQFWDCSSGVLVSTKGTFGGGVVSQPIISVCVLSQQHDLIATSMMDGCVAVWHCKSTMVVDKLVPPSNGKVVCIAAGADGSSLITADDKGYLLSWNITENKDTKKTSFDVNQIFEFADKIAAIAVTPAVANVRQSSFLNKDSELSFVSILSAENSITEVYFNPKNIFQGNPTNTLNLVQGHGKGTIWGVATHPKYPIAILAGDNCQVLLMNLETKLIIHRATLPRSAKSIAFREGSVDDDPYLSSKAVLEEMEATDGNMKDVQDEIAVGLVDGTIEIFKVANLTMVGWSKAFLYRTQHDLFGGFKQTPSDEVIAPPTDWIQVLRYSSTGKLLAAGCQDGNIYVIDMEEYSVLHKLTGHSSFVSHLDWAMPHDDGLSREYLQSTSGAKELLYWNASDGVQIKSAQHVANRRWATWTSPFGWQVQAFTEEKTALSRSLSGLNMVAGGMDGDIIITPFPCDLVSSLDQASKRYKAHTDFVTRLVFGCLDKYVISTSSDNTLCIWETEGWDAMYPVKEQWDKMSREDQVSFVEGSKKAKQEEDEGEDNFQLHASSSEAQLHRTAATMVPWKIDHHQWKNDVRVFTKSNLSAFSRSLSIEWVYGRSRTTPAFFVGPSRTKSDVLFTSGNMAVIQKPVREGQLCKQLFFAGHDCLITSLAIFGNYVATGDITGKVIVWETESLETLCNFSFDSGVKSLAISSETLAIILDNEEMHLASIALAEKIAFDAAKGVSSVAIGEFTKPTTFRSRTQEPGIVEIIGTGESFFKVWYYDPAAAQLTSKAIEVSRPLRCVVDFGGAYTAGAADGSLLVFNKENGTCSQVIHRDSLFKIANQQLDLSCPDIGTLISIQLSKDGSGMLLCAFSSGVVIPIDHRFSPQKHLCFMIPTSTLHFCIDALGTKILLCQTDGSLLEQSVVESPGNLKVLQDGRYSSNDESCHLVSSVFEEKNTFYCVEAAADRTVRLVDIDRHKVVAQQMLPDVPCSCTISPNSEHVVIGTRGGSIIVFTCKLDRQVASRDILAHKAKDSVRALRFSPDGMFLAVGCDDGKLRIYETRNYALFKILPKVHTGPITHADWSSDSTCLRTNSCVEVIPVRDAFQLVPRPKCNELLYWKAFQSCEPKEVVDRKWATATCPMTPDTVDHWNKKDSFPLNGWSSDNYLLLARNDGFIVSGDTAVAKSNHSGSFQVQVSPSDKYLITAGFYDGLIFQYKSTLNR